MERPQLPVVLQLTAQTIRRRPRKRHRDNRIELRQVAPLQRERSIDVVRPVGHERAVETGPGVACSHLRVHAIRPFTLFQCKQRRSVAFDGERLAPQTSAAGKMDRRFGASGGRGRCDVDRDVGSRVGIHIPHDTVVDGQPVNARNFLRPNEFPIAVPVCAAFEQDARLNQRQFT